MTNTKSIIYLDAAASALKPMAVIQAQTDFLENHYSNAGRGICARADYADRMVLAARESVSGFIGAAPEQIIFTSGATDGLNRIANMLPAGSLVAVSDLDHHSARLPFQMRHKTILCELDDNFNYKSVPQCDAVIITAMSNVLGVPQKIPKDKNRITIVDAAQYIAHQKIDVSQWDCDALVFSGHKIGADTGLGILYLKQPDKWQTDKFGGGQFMATGPAKFEAGTLPLTQLAGLPAAIKEQSPENMNHVKNCVNYLRGELSKISQIRFISPDSAALLSFVIDGMHVLDFGAMMGAQGVCLRVGNMCASWLHQRMGIDGTIRISVGPWNTMAEMEQVANIIKKVIK